MAIPTDVAVWHRNEDGLAMEPCETTSDVTNGYTNWHEE